MNLNESIKLTPVAYNPFASGDIVKIIAPIAPQQEIWLSCVLGDEDANRAYNESISLCFDGPLDVDTLHRAMDSVVSHHEALRSSFSSDGKSIVVYSSGSDTFDIRDLRGLAQEEQQAQISAYNNDNANKPFDLENGPLIRTALFRLSETENIFTFTAHHIICDGWSLGTVLYYLSKYYSAMVQGKSPDVVEPSTMEAYARETVAFQQSTDASAVARYWLDKFSGEIPVMELPMDFTRPTLRTYKSRRDDYKISPVLVSRIKNVGAQVNSSFVTTLLVAYEVLLYRLSGQNDLIIGLPAAGQSESGHFNLVSHCVNLLPIRSRIDGAENFINHLKKRRSAILDDLDHQRVTFSELVKKLHIKRDPSRVPLVPIVFNIDMGMNADVAFHNLSHKLISNPREYETFDIFLNASGTEDALTLEWSYNTQLFKPETIKHMMTQFETLLNAVVADPEIELDNIPLDVNTQPEAAFVAGPTVPYPKNKPFTSYITEIAAKAMDKTAIIFNEHSLSYGDLEKQSNQLANYLLSIGTAPGDVVGVAMDRSIEMVIALLGVSKAGATYIPLDPQYPANRIEFMLQDSGAKFLLTTSGYTNAFQSPAAVLCYERMGPEIAECATSAPKPGTSGEDVAYILYTSGSTGKPKGVQVTHSNLSNLLLGIQQSPGIAKGDIFLAITTISFDIAGLELYLPLITGATLLLADAELSKDAPQLIALAKEKRATIIQATPATWRMIVDSSSEKLAVRAFCGGEALQIDLARKLTDKCEAVFNMYGPTETTIYSTIKEITADSNVQITIGKPIANTQVYILNDEYRHVGRGREGQIFIAGDGVANGYINRSELTAEKFVVDIQNPDGMMYATGDLGYVTEEGEIRCLGRIDNQVKIRGFRIELGEIENQINELDGVREAVVLAREDKPGDQRLTAYLVTEKGRIDRSDIGLWRERLAMNLPHYMLPNDWVCQERFPMTANNKIDRQALPIPITIASTATSEPRDTALTENERKVREVWATVFNTDTLGKDDDFFELGGHSLLAVDVMTKIEQKTGIKIPLASLFKHSTITGLAALLDSERKIEWDCLVPIKPQGNKSPLYIVHGAGLNVLLFSSLVANLDEDQPLYGLQAKGLNGEDEPFTSIPEMAAHYVSEIISQNPEGPYALSGFSLGGLIAYEMARQLIAMGKEVKMLAMFDTFSHETDKFDPWYRKYPNRLRLLCMKGLHSVYLVGKDPIGTIKYKYTSLKRIVTATYWKIAGKQDDVVGFFGYLHKIDRINNEAVYDYVLEPINLEIHVFRATIHRFYAKDFKYLGWKKFAKKGVRIYDIPGEHNLIFAPPNDKEFGRILQKALNETTATRGVRQII